MRTPANDALFVDMFERSAVVVELDGPQIEAWVSGLFPLFDDDLTISAFVAYCRARNDPAAALLCRALAELTRAETSDLAAKAADALAEAMPEAGRQIGASTISGAWAVHAPFGRSVVLGFDNPVVLSAESDDLSHSILVELGDDGGLEDLQLAGPPRRLLDEAASADSRVEVTDLDVAEAVAMVVAAWPTTAADASRLGSGVAANAAFVRNRLERASGTALASIVVGDHQVDVRRGLDDAGFAAANRAALSTMQAAVGAHAAPARLTPLHDAWVAVIRGDAANVTARERDALLWLEWADWLGAGIGLLRAGAGSPVTGEAMVDHVNRCPEVSSTIAKSDRDYAAWAFDVAIEVLDDADVVVDGALSAAGFDSLGPAMTVAWQSSSHRDGRDDQ